MLLGHKKPPCPSHRDTCGSMASDIGTDTALFIRKVSNWGRPVNQQRVRGTTTNMNMKLWMDINKTLGEYKADGQIFIGVSNSFDFSPY